MKIIYRVTHFCGSCILWVPFHLPFTQRNAEKKTRKKRKEKKNPKRNHQCRYKVPICLIHSQPMCFILLSSTWHFKIRVISPAGAAPNKLYLDQTNVKCTKGRCCFFPPLYEPVPRVKFYIKTLEKMHRRSVP